MTMALVGDRYQVVIPRREREAMGLKPRTKVSITVQDGCAIVRPATASGWRGLGRELSKTERPLDYVRELRAEWGRTE